MEGTEVEVDAKALTPPNSAEPGADKASFSQADATLSPQAVKAGAAEKLTGTASPPSLAVSTVRPVAGVKRAREPASLAEENKRAKAEIAQLKKTKETLETALADSQARMRETERVREIAEALKRETENENQTLKQELMNVNVANGRLQGEKQQMMNEVRHTREEFSKQMDRTSMAQIEESIKSRKREEKIAADGHMVSLFQGGLLIACNVLSTVLYSTTTDGVYKATLLFDVIGPAPVMIFNVCDVAPQA